MPARVEKIARESLHMQLPAASRVQIVESPAGPPPTATSAAVAQAADSGERRP